VAAPGPGYLSRFHFRSIRMRPMLLLTAVSCAVLACQPAPAKLSDADVKALRAGVDSIEAQILSHRDSAAAAHYTENAVFMVPNLPTLEGRAAIRAWFAGGPPLASFTLTPKEIDGVGDLAYVRGTWTLAIAAAGKTPATLDHGKFLEVRRKQANGSWLIVADIFNSDVPLPTR
jgi:ketosteroid isomerase-like protein